MKIGEREKKFLIVIGVIIYIFFFVQYNLNKSIPGIKTNNVKIAKAQGELDLLKKDLARIKDLERTVTQLATANERYSDFIAQNADMVDTMEYMEKLKKLFNDKITGVSFDAPKSETRDAIKYYTFSTNFKTKLQISELNSLSSFIEGGAKKVKITKLNVTPSSGPSKTSEKKPTLDQENVEFNMDISINMYSLELGSVEKLYEMSRKKLEKFVGTDGIVFVPAEKLSGKLVSIKPGGDTVVPPVSVKKPDISFRLYSFFSGGSNFIMVGNGGINQEFANLKTQQRQSVTINFNNYVYSVDCLTTAGKKLHFSGAAPQRNLIVGVKATFPEIWENRDLGADIKIINSSDHSVGVFVEGRLDKINITDRNGTIIKTKSSTDKIFII